MREIRKILRPCELRAARKLLRVERARVSRPDAAPSPSLGKAVETFSSGPEGQSKVPGPAETSVSLTTAELARGGPRDLSPRHIPVKKKLPAVHVPLFL